MSQNLSPRWGHVILVNGYPILTTFPWCRRQTDRCTDKWLPKFQFFGWIKNQILLAMRLSSRRFAQPWSSAKTYLNLKTRKCLLSTLTLLEKSQCSEKSKLQTIFDYLTALQLLYNLTVGVVNFAVSRNTRKPNFIHNLLSFEGEIHDYIVEVNFVHLNLWVCMSFSCVTWAGFSWVDKDKIETF